MRFGESSAETHSSESQRNSPNSDADVAPPATRMEHEHEDVSLSDVSSARSPQRTPTNTKPPNHESASVSSSVSAWGPPEKATPQDVKGGRGVVVVPFHA
jgi:hypothetical protein